MVCLVWLSCHPPYKNPRPPSPPPITLPSCQEQYFTKHGRAAPRHGNCARRSWKWGRYQGEEGLVGQAPSRRLPQHGGRKCFLQAHPSRLHPGLSFSASYIIFSKKKEKKENLIFLLYVDYKSSIYMYVLHRDLRILKYETNCSIKIPFVLRIN